MEVVVLDRKDLAVTCGSPLLLPSSESDCWSGSLSSPFKREEQTLMRGFAGTGPDLVKSRGVRVSRTSWVQKETPVERLFSRGRLRSRMERGWDLSSPSFSSSFLSVSAQQEEEMRLSSSRL